MLTREEALAIYYAGPETVVTALCALSRQLDEAHVRITALEERVKELEAQISKNSHNSSKPPSSDGLKKKNRSLRPKGKRKPGGQKGHKGHTLEMVKDPDHTVVHPVNECSNCHCDLTGETVSGIEKRQEFDLPPPTGLESTEHQAEIKECPHCGNMSKANFPNGVNAPVQYGPRIKAVAGYLREYQLLPSQRTCELLADLFSCNLSEGTLANILNSISDILYEPVQAIAELIKAASVVNFDETGCSLSGKRHWLHVACTEWLTYYHVHSKRGSEATDEIGILPNFSGRAVHDHWKPYFNYDCDHALCNAHHLRELIFVHEQYNQIWAKQMIDCLINIKKVIDQTRVIADQLPENQLLNFEERYQEIIDLGYAENPIPDPPPGKKKRGRPKKSKPRNLLERLDVYRKETLAFMYDFSVPFDNNQAERDARMLKVQQKISGTFRTESGSKTFCRIRSYISTAKKNAVNVIEALKNALLGKPFVPTV